MMRFCCAAVVLCRLIGTCSADEKKLDAPVIGIDLGTTHSCVGIYRNGRVEIIPNEQGNRVTPSYVAFTDEDRLIGEAAKNQVALNPSRTVFDVKRFIGRRFLDPSVQKEMTLLPFQIVDISGKPYINLTIQGETKHLSPEYISAMILSKLKEIAESHLGTSVQQAVITVPAYFNDAQRQATKNAASIAGLNVLNILNEPSAAAIAYGIDQKGDRNILVYHLGGGTFDVSLLVLDSGVFEVEATSGDLHFGGDDFDQRVMHHLISVFRKRHSKDLSKDTRAMQKLRHEVTEAKHVLSSTHQAYIEIPSLHDGVDFSETLTRARFEEINLDLFKKTLSSLKQVLEDSGLQKQQVDEIVLVGGSTRIPKIRQLITEFFDGKEPNRGVSPDEVVAYGAAIQACILGGSCEQEHIDSMQRETKQRLAEDEHLTQRVDAKLALDSYLYSMRSSMDGSGYLKGLPEKIDDFEKNKILGILTDAQSWLDLNPVAGVDEIKATHKEVEAICAPIISRVYGTSNGEEDEREADDEL